MNKTINIEKINIKDNYLNNNSDENRIFLSSYKYPYLSSEILSHDYSFILDILINSNNNNTNNVKFNTNESIILNDTSTNELNFDMEGFMEDNFQKSNRYY